MLNLQQELKLFSNHSCKMNIAGIPKIFCMTQMCFQHTPLMTLLELPSEMAMSWLCQYHTTISTNFRTRAYRKCLNTVYTTISSEISFSNKIPSIQTFSIIKLVLTLNTIIIKPFVSYKNIVESFKYTI